MKLVNQFENPTTVQLLFAVIVAAAKTVNYHNGVQADGQYNPYKMDAFAAKFQGVAKFNPFVSATCPVADITGIERMQLEDAANAVVDAVRTGGKTPRLTMA